MLPCSRFLDEGRNRTDIPLSHSDSPRDGRVGRRPCSVCIHLPASTPPGPMTDSSPLRKQGRHGSLVGLRATPMNRFRCSESSVLPRFRSTCCMMYLYGSFNDAIPDHGRARVGGLLFPSPKRYSNSAIHLKEERSTHAYPPRERTFSLPLTSSCARRPRTQAGPCSASCHSCSTFSCRRRRSGPTCSS